MITVEDFDKIKEYCEDRSVCQDCPLWGYHICHMLAPEEWKTKELAKQFNFMINSVSKGGE